MQSFSNCPAASINDRVKALANNRILQISTLLDPRFAYNEELWTKVRWGFVEEELVAFARESIDYFFKVSL